MIPFLCFCMASQNAWDYIHNSYGLLRTPWNLDATPYVTRHNKTSGVASTRFINSPISIAPAGSVLFFRASNL